MKRQTAEAIARTAAMLRRADDNGIGERFHLQWSRDYWRKKMDALLSILAIYGDLAERASGRVVVDYGGGLGILTIMLKETGFAGEVVYNDIKPEVRDDAELLWAEVGVAPDWISLGDTPEMVEGLRGLPVEAVVSYDVLEHIYVLPDHYKALSSLEQAAVNLRVIHASGANAYNRRYVRWVAPIHKEHEKRYLKRRCEIIHDANPEIHASGLTALGKLTRGMTRSGIEKAARLGRGAFSMRHPTNTCDPDTGEWAENLMTHDYIKDAVERGGFDSVKIEPGTFGQYHGTPLRRLAKRALNTFIRRSPWGGMSLAPYFIVTAERD